MWTTPRFKRSGSICNPDTTGSRSQGVSNHIFFFILPYFIHPAKVLQSLRHSLDKEDDSNTSNKDTFETLQIRKSKRTTPQNQFSSLEFFIKSCHRGLNKLQHNHNTTKKSKKRRDSFQAADKSSA